jgi:hypothetical protein
MSAHQHHFLSAYIPKTAGVDDCLVVRYSKVLSRDHVRQDVAPAATQIYVHAHSSLRDDAQEWAAALTALMDASRPTAAAFLAGFVAKARAPPAPVPLSQHQCCSSPVCHCPVCYCSV